MSKIGMPGWVGIVLMVIGYVFIPEYALAVLRQGYAQMSAAGGAASPGDLSLQINQSMAVARLANPLGMAGVIAVILSFARRLPNH